MSSRASSSGWSSSRDADSASRWLACRNSSLRAPPWQLASVVFLESLSSGRMIIVVGCVFLFVAFFFAFEVYGVLRVIGCADI